MKKIIKTLSLFIVLLIMMVNCTEVEIRYIDPMIDGLSTNIESNVESLGEGSWNAALLGYRVERIRLLTMHARIEAGEYSGENYELENPEAAAARVEEALAKVEFKMDSTFNANIQDPFNDVDETSAGIQNFGLTSYNVAGLEVAEAYDFLMEASDDGNDENDWKTNDLAGLKNRVEVLLGLAALNEQEVIDFVNQLNAQYAEMVQQYADLATEVSTSPYFSEQQKEIYANLETPLEEMGVTIEENLSLDTKTELDAINSDLSALVYFVENNYVSPPRAPKVYGEISNIMELRWFSEVATNDDRDNNTWVLTADIDAAETHRWHPDAIGKGFQPIKPTVGCNFDGQNHIIWGLYMTKIGVAGDGELAGFFSDLRGGSIRNLGLVNVYSYVPPGSTGGQGGVLAGWLTNVTISNCFTHGQVTQSLSQTGGFIGRPQGGNVVRNCFAAVDMGPSVNPFTSSFIGLPVLDLVLENVYNLGFTDQKAFIGHGVVFSLTASNIYYDSESVGSTTLDRGGDLYTADSPTTLSDDGVVTDLPVGQWNNLSNFSGFSPDVWEIGTVPLIDPNPRPYLKGFNYDGFSEFIEPDNQ